MLPRSVPPTRTLPLSAYPVAFPAPLLPPRSVNGAEPDASVTLLACLNPQFMVRPGSSWSPHRWMSVHCERSIVTTTPEIGLLAMSRTTTWNWPIAVAATPWVEPTSEMQAGNVLFGPTGGEARAMEGMTAPITSNRVERRIDDLRLGAARRAGGHARPRGELVEPQRQVVRAHVAAAVVVRTAVRVAGAEVPEPRGEVVRADAARAVEVEGRDGRSLQEHTVRVDHAATEQGRGIAAAVAATQQREAHDAARRRELRHPRAGAVHGRGRIHLVRAEVHVDGIRDVDHDHRPCERI